MKLKQHLSVVGGSYGIVGELLARVERHIITDKDKVEAATQCNLPMVHFAAPGFQSESSSDSESITPFDADFSVKKRLSVVTRSQVK